MQLDETAPAEMIGCSFFELLNHGLGDRFLEGLAATWTGPDLNSELVRCFRMWGFWSDIDLVELYFAVSGGDSWLFMVRKVIPATSSDLDAAIDGLTSAVSEQIGHSPDEHLAGYYQNPGMAHRGEVGESRGSHWNISGIEAYLLIASPYGGAEDPQFFYLSEPQWDRYFETNVRYFEDRAREEEERSRDGASGFCLSTLRADADSPCIHRIARVHRGHQCREQRTQPETHQSRMFGL